MRRFAGANTFCFKACFDLTAQISGDRRRDVASPDYCQNRFDELGCSYNMPNNAVDGQFELCDGDVQKEIGVETSGGVSRCCFVF